MEHENNPKYCSQPLHNYMKHKKDNVTKCTEINSAFRFMLIKKIVSIVRKKFTKQKHQNSRLVEQRQ